MAQQITTWRDVLRTLDSHFTSFKQSRSNKASKRDDYSDSEDDEDEDRASDRLIQIMTAACSVIRQAEAKDHHELPQIVEKVGELLDRVISFAYSDMAFIRCIPSFAHAKETLVKDPMKGPIGEDANRGPGIAGLFPWTEELDQPHPRTTPLSRFRKDTRFPAQAFYPTANMIYQARCEITDAPTCNPIRLALSSDGVCLALSAAGGYKENDPIIHVWLNEDDKEKAQIDIKSTLADPAMYIDLDADRELIFVADKDRVKSYSWADGSAKPVHTLNSNNWTGPLALLPGGRIVRGGIGSLMSWTIDDLPTHDTIKGLIGPGKYSGYRKIAQRFEEKEMEFSTGSLPTTMIPLADSGLFTLNFCWHQPTQRMLCAENWPQRKSYAVVSLDLEHGGKTVTRFVGHGGGVGHIGLNEDDPNSFMTACSDGFTRLFDVRNPLPALTLDVERESAPCQTAVYTHIDGIPTIFTGGHKSEAVKLWDVRAKKTVVELSTGNNTVTSMVWNRKSTTLYAATECQSIDRFGNHYDYRPAHPFDLYKTPETLSKDAKTTKPGKEPLQ
ncbi:hypothetical protein EIP86_007641 [Pleurotus ostreatoroseus]|nr:hypothetical protein EIP86_007641 [Pleurotus ostreatoroseus]